MKMSYILTVILPSQPFIPEFGQTKFLAEGGRFFCLKAQWRKASVWKPKRLRIFDNTILVGIPFFFFFFPLWNLGFDILLQQQEPYKTPYS